MNRLTMQVIFIIFLIGCIIFKQDAGLRHLVVSSVKNLFLTTKKHSNYRQPKGLIGVLKAPAQRKQSGNKTSVKPAGGTFTSGWNGTSRGT
jgi:hypothetical protein